MDSTDALLYYIHEAMPQKISIVLLFWQTLGILSPAASVAFMHAS